MPEAMVDTLVEVDPYIIEARYPAAIAPLPPDEVLGIELLHRTEEALEWLLHRLK